MTQGRGVHLRSDRASLEPQDAVMHKAVKPWNRVSQARGDVAKRLAGLDRVPSGFSVSVRIK